MTMEVSYRGNLPAGVTIRSDLRPGDIGYLIYLHGILYAQEYGWDATFDAYVAGPLAKFAESRTDRGRIWIVEKDGVVAGSIAIVEVSQKQAQLRWFLLHPDLRGCGLGKLLIEKALSFCRQCGYSSVSLWTVSALKAAAHLYTSAGFRVTEEKAHDLWGTTLTEQRYELKLG